MDSYSQVGSNPASHGINALEGIVPTMRRKRVGRPTKSTAALSSLSGIAHTQTRTGGNQLLLVRFDPEPVRARIAAVALAGRNVP
jgi:hypothetical protein